MKQKGKTISPIEHTDDENLKPRGHGSGVGEDDEVEEQAMVPKDELEEFATKYEKLRIQVEE